MRATWSRVFAIAVTIGMLHSDFAVAAAGIVMQLTSMEELFA